MFGLLLVSIVAREFNFGPLAGLQQDFENSLWGSLPILPSVRSRLEALPFFVGQVAPRTLTGSFSYPGLRDLLRTSTVAQASGRFASLADRSSSRKSRQPGLTSFHPFRAVLGHQKRLMRYEETLVKCTSNTDKHGVLFYGNLDTTGEPSRFLSFQLWQSP